MSRNAGSDENGDSGEISSVNLTIFMQITSTEMGLTCWRIWRFWRFLLKLRLANWTITRDGSNALANLANLRFLCKLHHQRWANVLVNLTISAISITSRVEAEQKDMYFLRYISRDGLTCWRIWRFGRFLLHHEWGPSRKIYIFFVH